MDGLYGKFLQKWMLSGYPYDSGNHQLDKTALGPKLPSHRMVHRGTCEALEGPRHTQGWMHLRHRVNGALRPDPCISLRQPPLLFRDVGRKWSKIFGMWTREYICHRISCCGRASPKSQGLDFWGNRPETFSQNTGWLMEFNSDSKKGVRL